MATAVKRLDNMKKHLLQSEKRARAEAEAETLPERSRVKLKAPSYISRDRRAKRYWRETIARMEGITLLDDLDTEMLAIYCTMLSRRDAMNELCRVLVEEIELLGKGVAAPSAADAPGAAADSAAEECPETVAEARVAAMGKLDSLMTKLQGQERTILQYAEKLGLTPSGRVRLARKRAEARVVSAEDALYGD